MAVTSDPYTATDLQYVIGEKWADMLLEPQFAKVSILNWATDLSEFLDEGDILNIPDIYTNVFTAQTQSTQGAEITTESVATANRQLTVNTHKYVAFLIGDKDMVQMFKRYRLVEKYIDEATNLLVKGVEESLFGLWSSVTTHTVGDTSSSITDADIRKAFAKLTGSETTNAVELEDLMLFVHPDVYFRQLFGIAKYYDHSISGLDLIKTGNFGSMQPHGHVYGVPIMYSSRVVSSLQTYRNLMCTREALGFAFQTQLMSNGAGGRFRPIVTYEHRNLATLATVDTLYGVAVLRENNACVINANTTAVTS